MKTNNKNINSMSHVGLKTNGEGRGFGFGNCCYIQGMSTSELLMTVWMPDYEVYLGSGCSHGTKLDTSYGSYVKFRESSVRVLIPENIVFMPTEICINEIHK